MKRSQGKASGRRTLKIVRSALELLGQRIDGKNIPLALRDLSCLVRLESDMSDRNAARQTKVMWIKPRPQPAPRARRPPVDDAGDDLGDTIMPLTGTGH